MRPLLRALAYLLAELSMWLHGHAERRVERHPVPISTRLAWRVGRVAGSLWASVRPLVRRAAWTLLVLALIASVLSIVLFVTDWWQRHG